MPLQRLTASAPCPASNLWRCGAWSHGPHVPRCDGALHPRLFKTCDATVQGPGTAHLALSSLNRPGSSQSRCLPPRRGRHGRMTALSYSCGSSGPEGVTAQQVRGRLPVGLRSRRLAASDIKCEQHVSHSRMLSGGLGMAAREGTSRRCQRSFDGSIVIASVATQARQ